MSEPAPPEPRPESRPETGAAAQRDAERMKFFTDAVVAIAMTLLILPLLESVSEARELSTSEFLSEHQSQLLSFAISFVVIASFWVSHERLFDWVESWTGPLMVLNVAWMLTIVFLPVATAMSGSMVTDRGQIAIYVGTMLASSLMMLGMSLVVRGDRRVWGDGGPPGNGGLAAVLTLVLLFALALGLGMVVPGAGYLWLFLLFLTGPLQGVVERVLDGRVSPRTP